MAITKLSTNGIYGDKYGDIAANNSNWYEAIATTTLGSTVSSFTFSNIPSDYTHLQLRCIYKTDRATSSVGAAYLTIRANSDSGSNYSFHRLYGEGTGAFSDGATANATYFNGGNMIGNSSTTNVFHAAVIDILDYKDTSKFKTMRSLNGVDNNGSGNMALFSSNWRNTNAITSLTLGADAGTYNLLAGSKFSLYGLRG